MPKVIVKVTPIIAKELLPGELFTTYPQSYWDKAMNTSSIGERVYIRTNTPAEAAPDSDSTVYKVEIFQFATLDDLDPIDKA